MARAVRHQRRGTPGTRRSTGGPEAAIDAVGLLSGLEVWIDTAGGSRGIMDVTIELDGSTTDEGDHWALSGADAGVCVDGYTGELTVNPAGVIGAAGNPPLRGFMVCDMGAITAGSTNRRIWSNQVATSANAAGLAIVEASADEFFPSALIANGSAELATTTNAVNIEGAGRVVVAWSLVEFLGIVSATAVNVVTAAGPQTGTVLNVDALSTFEIPHNGMVFGAGCDSATTGPSGGPSAAGGPDGAAHWRVYAGGFDRTSAVGWTTDELAAIARYYGVLA